MKKETTSKQIPALKWGIKSEDVARESYISTIRNAHVGLQYTTSGLWINAEYPHLGTSPDGIVTCECCGEGPYKYRDIDHK